MLLNLNKSLFNFENQKKYSNDASRFLPIGPDPIREQDLNWNLVYKTIYENLLGLQCSIKDSSQLYENILDSIASDRDTRELKLLIQEVYLNESSLRIISPYLNLICADKSKARSKTMVSIFSSMLSDFKPLEIDFSGANFLEGIINNLIKHQCSEHSSSEVEIAYLPFLSNHFKNDLRVMSSNINWLSDEFSLFVELYSFLYLTQLSLHLGLVNERFQEPKSQEVYFILESEKASKERHECNIKGYDRILSSRNGFALDVFPHLGYLELLSDKPIWMLSNNHIDSEKILEINKLNRFLCNQFDISYMDDQPDVESAINDGLYYHRELFKKGTLTSSRVDANDKVFKTFSDAFSLNFKSNRRAAGGWYFQLNTKTVLLITNLIIGSKKKLLINDVVDGFKQRGIYFDLKSKNALLKVYENIGNIEKLSDSGDAVYVKSTI